MVRSTTRDANRDEDTTPSTFFDKVVALEEGDTIDLLGESLKVGHIRQSAASKTVSVWGKHEDHTQPPRYDLVADARYDDVDVCTTERTDSHEN